MTTEGKNNEAKNKFLHTVVPWHTLLIVLLLGALSPFVAGYIRVSIYAPEYLSNCVMPPVAIMVVSLLYIFPLLIAAVVGNNSRWRFWGGVIPAFIFMFVFIIFVSDSGAQAGVAILLIPFYAIPVVGIGAYLGDFLYTVIKKYNSKKNKTDSKTE